MFTMDYLAFHLLIPSGCFTLVGLMFLFSSRMRRVERLKQYRSMLFTLSQVDKIGHSVCHKQLRTALNKLMEDDQL